MADVSLTSANFKCIMRIKSAFTAAKERMEGDGKDRIDAMRAMDAEEAPPREDLATMEYL